MVIFSLIGKSGISAVCDNISIDIFPKDGKKGSADITLLTNPEEIPTEGIISWPGEYDMQGVSLRGIGHNDGAQVSFVLEIDNARCAFLSSPLHDWSDNDLALLGNVDVLFLPAGDTKLTQKLIDEIDPRILIPIQNGDADKFAELLKVSGAQGKEVEKEYKLKGLPSEGREVIVLG